MGRSRNRGVPDITRSEETELLRSRPGQRKGVNTRKGHTSAMITLLREAKSKDPGAMSNEVRAKRESRQTDAQPRGRCGSAVSSDKQKTKKKDGAANFINLTNASAKAARDRVFGCSSRQKSKLTIDSGALQNRFSGSHIIPPAIPHQQIPGVLSVPSKISRPSPVCAAF